MCERAVDEDDDVALIGDGEGVLRSAAELEGETAHVNNYFVTVYRAHSNMQRLCTVLASAETTEIRGKCQQVVSYQEENKRRTRTKTWN